MSVRPDFVLFRTPQFPRQKHTSEHLFYRAVPSGCLKMSAILSEREKPKIFFAPPEAVVRRCSVNKGVLKNFTKFTGKHQHQSLSSNKFAGLRLWHRPKALALAQFSCEFCEDFKKIFFKEDLQRLLLFLLCS